MIVLDVLLAANLVIFAVCAVRVRRPGIVRIDDLVNRALFPRSQALPSSRGVVVPFPSHPAAQRRRSSGGHA